MGDLAVDLIELLEIYQPRTNIEIIRALALEDRKAKTGGRILLKDVVKVARAHVDDWENGVINCDRNPGEKSTTHYYRLGTKGRDVARHAITGIKRGSRHIAKNLKLLEKAVQHQDLDPTVRMGAMRLLADTSRAQAAIDADMRVLELVQPLLMAMAENNSKAPSDVDRGLEKPKEETVRAWAARLEQEAKQREAINADLFPNEAKKLEDN